MKDKLYDFFTSKAFLISLIIIASLGLIGVGVWSGISFFMKSEDKPKTYYSVSGYFVDEDKQLLVEGVQIKVGDTVKGYSNSSGKFEIKYLEEGTILVFEKENYDFNPSTIKVDKDINDIFVNSHNNEADLTKVFKIKITDVNKLPLSNVSVIISKNRVGFTNTDGIFELSMTEGQKSVTFTHDYYKINGVVIDYTDENLDINITASFNLEKYLYYTDSDGVQQTRNFTTGFTFRTTDGRVVSNAKIYYKLMNEDFFRYTTGSSIVFENKIFETAFAYAFDSVTNTWICSDLLRTSKLGGNIYLEQGVRISASVDEVRGTVYTSSGYYFLANENKNIEIVIKSYEGEQFFKEMEYGYPKYQLQLFDSNNQVVSYIDGELINGEFKLK